MKSWADLYQTWHLFYTRYSHAINYHMQLNLMCLGLTFPKLGQYIATNLLEWPLDLFRIMNPIKQVPFEMGPYIIQCTFTRGV